MKNLLFLFITVTAFTAFSQTKTVAGVKFSTTTKVNGKTLDMNGGGLREKYWIDFSRKTPPSPESNMNPLKNIFTN